MTDELPTTISFTAEDNKRMAKRDKLREGWYMFIIRDHRKGTTLKGHLKSVFQCAPLKDPLDESTATTPKAGYTLIYPVLNPNKEGHEIPKTHGYANAFVEAIFTEGLPGFPRRIEGKLIWKGEEIDVSEEENARQVAQAAISEKLTTIWNDEMDEMLNHVFYGQVEHSGDWANIRKAFAELPAGAELVPVDQFIAG